MEFRPQQLEMALAIADALESKRHLIVEAPTGVGKSLAYLVPAILFALGASPRATLSLRPERLDEDSQAEGLSKSRGAKRKAIISTHTKNLQEQLFHKDLPIARKLLGVEFSAVILKGRRNYLCTSRLAAAMAQQTLLLEGTEANDLARIAAWAESTADGDFESLPFQPSFQVKQLVCSETGSCSTQRCGSQCFFQKAKVLARSADILIVNNALFFTLLAMREADDHYLYPDDFVIFDEAHTLEQSAGLGIGKSISKQQVLFAIHRLYNPKTKKGLFKSVRSKSLKQLCEEAETATGTFFDAAANVVRRNAKGSTFLVRQPHLIADTVTGPLKSLQAVAKEAIDGQKTKLNAEETVGAVRLLWEAEVLISEFLARSNPALTYWVEAGTGRAQNIHLHTSPTSIADSMGPRLFRDNATVILTSATLAVNATMDYVQSRLGAGSARTLILDTPFDFHRQMRVTIAKGIPSPDQPAYLDALPEWILRAVKRSKGRALVLFTSTKTMQLCANQLRDELESDGLTLLVQDGLRPRHHLLEEFRKDVGSVLFGLDSFWMGVDVPGEALEHVIITRLPFAVPDHPLVESRMEYITQHQGNAFFDYQLPEAILKFRQGVGRLIRSTSDKGRITILDARIMTKQYGRAFIASIPECPIEIMGEEGNVEDVEI